MWQPLLLLEAKGEGEGNDYEYIQSADEKFINPTKKIQRTKSTECVCCGRNQDGG